MISRRNIRIKVFQALYGFSSGETPPPQADIQKNLRNKFEQTGQLLVYLVHYITEIGLYADVYARNRAARLLPTEKDLNIDARLASDGFLMSILNDTNLILAVKRIKPANYTDHELVKQLFIELEQSEVYRNYLVTDPQDKKAGQDVVRYIFNSIMLPSTDFESASIEWFSHYDDDIEMLHQLVNAYIDRPGSLTFNNIISKDKELFAQKLAGLTLEKEEMLMELIRPCLRNWDPERVARIDMLLLRMGVCELLFFETIPPKVTINEYIDLAKEYSTPQSGQFVNGILDHIHKDLLTQNRINKVDFRKAK
jgi:transcription antitermination protein NusB